MIKESTQETIVEELFRFVKGLFLFQMDLKLAAVNKQPIARLLLEDQEVIDKYDSCFRFDLDEEILQLMDFTDKVEEYYGLHIKLLDDHRSKSTVTSGLLVAKESLRRLEKALGEEREMMSDIIGFDLCTLDEGQTYNPFGQGVASFRKKFDEWVELFMEKAEGTKVFY